MGDVTVVKKFPWVRGVAPGTVGITVRITAVLEKEAGVWGRVHAGAGHGREGERYEISLLSLGDERSCFFGREVGRVIFQGAYEASDS